MIGRQMNIYIRKPVYFTVTWRANGNTLKTEQVEAGFAAIPPVVNVEFYTLKGWDKPYNKITSNITINAVLEKLPTCIVRFIKDTTVLKTQEILVGGNATPPDGYTSGTNNEYESSWDKPYTNISVDTDIYLKLLHINVSDILSDTVSLFVRKANNKTLTYAPDNADGITKTGMINLAEMEQSLKPHDKIIPINDHALCTVTDNGLYFSGIIHALHHGTKSREILSYQNIANDNTIIWAQIYDDVIYYINSSGEMYVGGDFTTSSYLNLTFKRVTSNLDVTSLTHYNTTPRVIISNISKYNGAQLIHTFNLLFKDGKMRKVIVSTANLSEGFKIGISDSDSDLKFLANTSVKRVVYSYNKQLIETTDNKVYIVTGINLYKYYTFDKLNEHVTFKYECVSDKNPQLHDIAYIESSTFSSSRDAIVTTNGDLYGVPCEVDDYYGPSRSEVKLLLNNVKQVVNTSYGYICLTNNNEIYVMGRNPRGELGVGHKNPVPTMTKLNLNFKVKKLGSIYWDNIILSEDGRLYYSGQGEINTTIEQNGVHKNNSSYVFTRI